MTEPRRETKPILVENADILFRNFAGIERDFNSEGDRNFSLVLEPELAQKLKAEGWRVKQLKPKEEGEEGTYHLKVNVNYKTGRPPRVVLITKSNPRTELGQDEVAMIDVIDIEKVDVLVNGHWSDNQGGGFAGYLKSIFVTMNEDELERKYANMSPSEAADVLVSE